MELTKKFSKVLSLYNDFLNQREVTDEILHLEAGDSALPVAAAIVWLKVRTGVKLSEVDYHVVQRIQKEWSELAKNVFDETKDLYTSNLAIYYVTLAEVKNDYELLDLQKELTEIRDFIFDNLIRKGTLISSLKKNKPDFDLVFSVLPFGLFAPEDLIMVAGIQELASQATVVSKNEASLLGIYFTEKYDFIKADSYLREVGAAHGDSTVLAELFKTYLTQKKDTISADAFIHKPLGNGNIYDTLPYERLPHYPEAGERCIFNVQVNKTDVQQVTMKLEGFADILCELIDEELHIYQAKAEIPETYSGGGYFFTAAGATLEVSQTYQLLIKKQTVITELNFLGSNQAGNIYQVETADDAVFLLLQRSKIKLLLESPVIETEELNHRCARFDLNNKTVFIDDQPIVIFHEQILQIQELLGKGIVGAVFKITDKATLYYGFGERYNGINQFGNSLDCFVYNQYRDQGTLTYLPIPYYITDNGYGVYVSTDYYTKFDLQKKKCGVVEILIETEANDFLVELELLHGTMNEMISQYMSATGKPKMVPSWALGPWMSSNNWDRESVVRKQVELTNQYDIPSTVIVLEQWSDEATYYMFNDAQYPLLTAGKSHSYDQITFPEWGRWPDPKGLIDYCHENGLKFILWQVPIEKYLNQQKHTLKDQDEAYMIEKGYAVQNEDGTPYRIPENWFTDSLLLDFTNDEAKQWWFEKRQYLIDIGVDGFKTDGGEMVYGPEVKFSDGSTGRKMRNRYPKEYIKAYYEFAQQNDGITFSRAGYTGAQTFPAHWAGDERSTFDAFERQLIAGINSGMSGIIFWGWDLGGFNGDIPTAELFMRSAAMAAFCPIMQYHAESKGEFNQDRTPWNIAERTNTPEVIDVYRFFANTRMNLLPYIYDQSQRAVEQYKPLMKALQLEYPREDFVNCYDQFLFGDSLLVAPIIEEGSTIRIVQLPKGTWTDFWTHEVFEGGTTIEVSAKVQQIPVFIKENSAIILNLGTANAIGESIGNDLTHYTRAKLVVTAKNNFEQTIHDHLGNTIHVKVDTAKQKVFYDSDLEIDVDWVGL